jgi:DNA-binding GntR family transcriptional regulator
MATRDSGAPKSGAPNGDEWETELQTARFTPRNTLHRQIVSAILKDILSGELRGDDRLIETALARKLGVSRTPIREAFRELAAIELIRLIPNCGAIVCPFGPSQLIEIYHVRRILEVEATRLACEHIDEVALESIRQQTQDLIEKKQRGPAWEATALALDQAFHELVSVSSGRQRLANEIGKYRAIVVAAGEAVGNRLQAHDQNLSEHIAVITHLQAHRADDAASAMGRHIDRGGATAAAVLGSIFAGAR